MKYQYEILSLIMLFGIIIVHSYRDQWKTMQTDTRLTSTAALVEVEAFDAAGEQAGQSAIKSGGPSHECRTCSRLVKR